jgi:DNA polymerase III delta prime subunit
MGKARTALTLLNASPYLVRLLCSLFSMWLTLGWKVRKARKAFEKELIKQGMSKEDAKRLSAQYTILKDNLMKGLKRYIRIR